jgi:hypothetical protein
MTSIDRSDISLMIKLNQKKMSDITDLLDEKEFENEEFLSMNFVDYLHTHCFENNEENYDWQIEENYLKYGKKKVFSIDFIFD